ncbi:MAG: Smr/MutS family protein [Holosporaceae bacterium]|jgi:DNA-nicking Smr family endonuclease|nr:Smr/MutS family protein [Holosporaceae bacterium]
MQKTMKDHLRSVKPLTIRNPTIELCETKRKLPPRKRPPNPSNVHSPRRSEPSPLSRKSSRKFDFSRRIDLHGLSQNDAFQALIEFFVRCQSEKVKKILVITGGNWLKESPLRDSFMKWVQDSFGDYVVSCSQANLRHGGQGAFYVTLKKPPCE